MKRFNLAQVYQQLQLYYRNQHTRQSLKTLDSRQLADIGKTPEEAQREARLPFWKTRNTASAQR